MTFTDILSQNSGGFLKKFDDYKGKSFVFTLGKTADQESVIIVTPQGMEPVSFIAGQMPEESEAQKTMDNIVLIMYAKEIIRPSKNSQAPMQQSKNPLSELTHVLDKYSNII